MRIPKFRRNTGRESVARRERPVGQGARGREGGSTIEQRMGNDRKVAEMGRRCRP